MDAVGSNASECKECEPGRYAEQAGGAACLNCPVGRYNPLPGRPFCSTCPAGAICESENETGARGFVSAPGFYFLGDNESVKSEFLKQVSDASWNSYSRSGFHSFGPFRCPADGACKGGNECAEGMYGALCGSCIDDWVHKDPANLCVQCPAMHRTIGWFVLFIFALWCAALWIDRKHASRMGKPKQVRAVVIKVMYRFLVQMSVVNSNIRLQDTLTSAQDSNSMNYPWALPMLGALNFGKALENPSSDMFSLGCISNSDGFEILIAWFYAPIVMLFHFIFLTLVMLVVWARRRTRVAPAPPERIPGLARKSSREMLWNLPIIDMLWNNYRGIGIVLVYFLHPMITTQFLSAFDCIGYDDEHGLDYDEPRLRLNLETPCYGEEHISTQILAFFGIMTWSIGIPLGFCAIVWWYNNHGGADSLNTPKVWRVYGFLMDGYEPNFYYYDAVFMLRRVLFLIGARLTFFSEDNRTVIMMAIDVAFLGMHLYHQPYDNRAYASLDKLETLGIFMVFFFLLGRLFEVTLDANRLSNPQMFIRLGYSPAFVSFFIVSFYGIYLGLRFIIWPPDRPCTVLPRPILDKLDGRVHFTLIPPEKDEIFMDKDEHVNISSKSLNNLTLGYGDVEARALPERERQLLKSVLAACTDIVVQRYEQCKGEAPDVICLPSFLLQIERVYTACMCKALKTRLTQTAKKKELDTFSKKLANAKSNAVKQAHLIMGLDRENSEHDNVTDSRSVHEEMVIVRRPVSCEEIHLALMDLGPKLMDPDTNRYENYLQDFAQQNKALLDAHSNVTWLFNKEAHKQRVDEWQSEEVRERNSPKRTLSSASMGKSTDSSASMGSEVAMFQAAMSSARAADLQVDEYLPFEIRDVPVLLHQAGGYLVDNSMLKSQLAGLPCRNSKDAEDKGKRIIDFGSTVNGIVEQAEDGAKWLKITKAEMGISLSQLEEAKGLIDLARREQAQAADALRQVQEEKRQVQEERMKMEHVWRSIAVQRKTAERALRATALAQGDASAVLSYVSSVHEDF